MMRKHLHVQPRRFKMYYSIDFCCLRQTFEKHEHTLQRRHLSCFAATLNVTFNMCEERDLANSPPKREVNGVRISSASSSSSSSPPPSPIVAELLLFARRAFLSLRAAYLERPLGYWSSPGIKVSYCLHKHRSSHLRSFLRRIHLVLAPFAQK